MVRSLILLVLGGLSLTALPAQTPPAAWIAAGQALPVVAGGRVQPLETWAQTLYGQLSGYSHDSAALGWLLTVFVHPELADQQPVILVNDPSILQAYGLNLPEKRRYSALELAPLFAAAETGLGPQAEGLSANLRLYARLRATLQWQSPLAVQSPLRLFRLGGLPLNPAEFLQPTLKKSQDERDQLGLLLLWQTQSQHGQWDEAGLALKLLAHKITQATPQASAALNWEELYQRVPWMGLLSLMIALALLLSFQQKVWSRQIFRWLIGLSALSLGLRLVIRGLIMGQPPLTDLPSTFVFVAALCLGLSCGLGRRDAPSLVPQLLAGLGFGLSLLAEAFQASGDPFAPLPAVLNTQFWLTCHVTVIVSGYAASLVAALLGHAFLLGGLRTNPRQWAGLWASLKTSLLVALSLTCLGTLLGGFWADQSWGRFWGWDPKENGALLLILWLALCLHLKPAGLAAEWGTALAAAAGFIVLLFSWLGINLIGTGLHTYGFVPEKALVFLILVALDAALLGFLVLRRLFR